MAKNQSQKTDNTGFNPMTIVICAGLGFFVLYIFWWRFHTPLSMVYGYYRMLTNAPAWLIGEWVWNVPILIAPYHDAAAFLRATPPEQILLSDIVRTSWPVNVGLLLLVSLPLIVRSIRQSIRTNPLNHKNYGRARDFTVHTFMKAQETVYPHLKLYGALNMLKQPVNSGALRMADNEKQFAVKHGLIASGSSAQSTRIDAEKARKVFRQQLGAYWEDLDALQPHELILFAAFAPKSAATDHKMSDGDYKKSLDLSGELLNACWTTLAPSERGRVPSTAEMRKILHSSPLYAKARSVAQQYSKNHIVSGIMRRHAFVLTGFYELLVTARYTGVLPAAEFRWLKLIDRRMWFVLNTVGRSVAVPEVAGVYAHYLYEMKAGVAIERPMVDNAAEALQEAFEKTMFTDAEWAAALENSPTDEVAVDHA